MFGCVVNPGPPSSWPRVLETESTVPPGAGLSYNEALKRTVYMAEFFYPAVIPLASSLPASHVPSPWRSPSSSSDLKFGIDRILGSSKCSSTKEDAPKTEKSTSPERRSTTSPTSPRGSHAASSPGRRSPGSRRREIPMGQARELHMGRNDNSLRGQQPKHCAPSPPTLHQDFLHDLKFHQQMRPILPSPHDLHRPPGALCHPQDLRTRPPEFIGAQELHGRHFPSYPCPGASPPAGLVTYHSPLHPVHLGLHYQTPAHRHDYEGSYSVMTSELPGHRSHHPTSGPQTTQPKRKRSWSRAVFSHLQRKGLEKRFEVQKYVTKPDRKQLAAMLGLTDAQVKVWFQNRRMKWRHAEEAKRKKEESDDVTTEQTSSSDITQASSGVDASQDSDDDELCIDDVDDDSIGDSHDDVTITDQSDVSKS